jgi:4-hydroxy-tetrahydrodipicolinate synthase
MVPLVTPVGADGEVREADVAAMVAALAPYADALVPALSTGEGWALDDRRWSDMVAHTVRHAGGLPVLAGALRPGTAEVVARSRAAADLGARAVVATTPFGPDVAQEAMVEHYATLAGTGPLPVVVYHESAVSGNTMTPQTLRRVCDLPGVAAVKDSSGDPRCLGRLRAAGSSVALWQGREEAVGGCGPVDGYLLALAHVAPELCARLDREGPAAPGLADRVAAAVAGHGLLGDDWYLAVKATLHQRGIIADPRPISTR